MEEVLRNILDEVTGTMVAEKLIDEAERKALAAVLKGIPGHRIAVVVKEVPPSDRHYYLALGPLDPANFDRKMRVPLFARGQAVFGSLTHEDALKRLQSEGLSPDYNTTKDVADYFRRHAVGFPQDVLPEIPDSWAPVSRDSLAALPITGDLPYPEHPHDVPAGLHRWDWYDLARVNPDKHICRITRDGTIWLFGTRIASDWAITTLPSKIKPNIEWATDQMPGILQGALIAHAAYKRRQGP